MVGHSYGSLVTGMAESEQGLEVDETVLIGSPGVGVSSADDLNEGSESLRNIGLIAAGYLDEVNVNDGLF